MKTFGLLILNILLSLFTTFNLLSQLTFTGNIRNRSELRYGQGMLPDSSKYPAFFVNQRTRLLLNYKNQKYSVGIIVQDSRVWGDSEPKNVNNSINLFESWIKYHITNNLALKFGRQRLIYDDQRLFSESNWNNKGSSHDIAVLQFENNDKLFAGHIGLGVNAMKEDKFLSDYNLNYYKYLSYIWISKGLTKKLNISIIDILDANQKPDHEKIIYVRNTIGTNLNYDLKKLSLRGIFYLQQGSNKTGKKVLSNFYSAKISYDIIKKIQLTTGYDHYSGTDLSDTIKTSSETNSFSKLYGSNHRFLGYMDYFGKDISSANFGAGINNFFVNINNSLTHKISLQATYHWFSLDKEYLSSSNRVNKYLGSEIDLMLTYQVSNDISLKAGYSFMLPNETLEIISGIDAGKSKFAQFGWLQVQFNPIFYPNK